MGTTTVVLVGIACLAALCAGADGVSDVRARLTSPAIEGLYSRTYRSIVDRVEPDGFFQESLTGAYAGMFPRTVGGLVSLFMETGRVDLARRTIEAVLRTTEANGMTRAPHVMGRKSRDSAPIPGSEPLVATAHPIALYRLDSGFAGAARLAATGSPILAVEAWITASHKGAQLTCTLVSALDDTRPLARATTRVGDRLEAGGWVRFRFARRATPARGSIVYLRISSSGTDPCAWWGTAGAAGQPMAGGYGHDPAPAHWIDCPDHVPAYAVDTGRLRHTRGTAYPVISRSDQADGNFHVLASWARVTLSGEREPWEDRSYAQVARLVDFATDWPYVAPMVPRIWPGLVRNVCLEHSREGRYWDCWDLLTQSWACQTLRLMEQVARRRGDGDHALSWQDRRICIERAVRERLTMEVDGRLVYAEMRLPDGGEGRLFEGLSWVNLSPVQAQWEGADPAILRATIETYRSKAALRWKDLTVTGTEWLPGKPVTQQVIGKGVGWDLAYSAQTGDWATASNWLAFVERANSAQVYAEAFNFGADGAVVMQDPGNGEQVSWWCWGMARLRKAVGLPVLPKG